MTEPVKQIKGMAERLARAAEIVDQGWIEPMEDLEGAYCCGQYVVMPDGRCNCPDYCNRQDLHAGWCKHRIAARLIGAAQDGGGLTLRVCVVEGDREPELIPIPNPCWR